VIDLRQRNLIKS